MQHASRVFDDEANAFTPRPIARWYQQDFLRSLSRTLGAFKHVLGSHLSSCCASGEMFESDDCTATHLPSFYMRPLQQHALSYCKAVMIRNAVE